MTYETIEIASAAALFGGELRRREGAIRYR
jgi:hypothetical protein